MTTKQVKKCLDLCLAFEWLIIALVHIYLRKAEVTYLDRCCQVNKGIDSDR